jgi:hypothetical protein
VSRDLKAPAAYMADLLISLHYFSWPSPFVLVYLLQAVTPSVSVPHMTLWVLLLLVNGVQLFYAWQLHFDALLFRTLAASSDDGSELDAFLLRQFNKVPRQTNLHSRLSGSQSLIRRYLLVTALFYVSLGFAAYGGGLTRL